MGTDAGKPVNEMLVQGNSSLAASVFSGQEVTRSVLECEEGKAGVGGFTRDERYNVTQENGRMTEWRKECSQMARQQEEQQGFVVRNLQ